MGLAVLLEKIVVSSWRLCFGGCVQGFRGETCRQNSVTQFRRFRRWAAAGVFEKLFEALNQDPDFEYALIDGTIVSVHQKASGAKGGLKIRPLDVQEVD